MIMLYVNPEIYFLTFMFKDCDRSLVTKADASNSVGYMARE
jgi:hypothetical protein